MRFHFNPARTLLTVLLTGALSLMGAETTANTGLGQANAALQAGEADKALELLKPLTQAGPGQAAADNLECRVLLNLEQWDHAASACEKAVSLEPQNSLYHLWLGRALGEKAGRASFMSAYSLGKRVREEFETSVRLNPRSAEALADLGEFYYSAPSVVGGGTGKAEGVAAQLDNLDAARAHELRGRIAEEHKDYSAAEREFKQAIAVAAHPAFQWATMASFLRRRERWAEMDAAIHNCIAAAEHDKHAGVALYDAASILIKSNRESALAAKMIESYLASSQKTEEAPAFVAHVRLGRLKEQTGDPEGAKREQAFALALAHEYKPAQDMKH